jgi:hypothetical protein
MGAILSGPTGFMFIDPPRRRPDGRIGYRNLSIIANAPWHIAITSSTAGGQMTNGATPPVLTVNAVQWASSALTGSGYGAWAPMSSTAGVWAAGGATAGVSFFGAYQWCAAAADQGGTYSITSNYVLTSP